MAKPKSKPRKPRKPKPSAAKAEPSPKPKPKTKTAKPARHAKRAKMTATALIRSLPTEMPAKEVVRRAEARGLKLRPELVYNVRSKMREEQKQRAFEGRDAPAPTPVPSPAHVEDLLPARHRKPELDVVARTILFDAHRRIVKECADEFLASYLAKLAAVVKALPSMPHSVGEILVMIMAGIAEEG